MNVTIFKSLFGSKDVPYIVHIDKVIDRIKNGKSKELLSKIRLEEDKSKRDALKRNLPAILFSGEFSERNKKGCKVHSGLMITDFDNFPNEEEYERIWTELTQNPHVYCVFMSPSGKKGLKAVIRIPPCDIHAHTRYFKQFNEEFQIDYWDRSNSDISRVCFESYDPDIYVNKEAEVYSPTLEDKGFNTQEHSVVTPVIEEAEIIKRIMSWNWSKSYSPGQRNSYIYDIAGAFCEFGISQETTYSYIRQNIINDDFEDKRLRNTIANSFRNRVPNSRVFEDRKKRDQLKRDIANKEKIDVINKYHLSEDEYEELKQQDEDNQFWFITQDKHGNEKVSIDPYKYKTFLERNGFKKHFQSGAQKPTLVKINSNKVTETSAEKIKDFVLTYLLEMEEIVVWNYCANFQMLFTESYLSMLDTVELFMLRDTKDLSFIAFDNGILKVTPTHTELIDYIDVNGYIWENHIIKHDFIPDKNINNDYRKFIHNVSGGAIDSFETVLGYLCSTYKNKMNNKAVILNDEVISDNPEGGTGKGLFAQGVSQIRRTSILDGKTFDDKKSFPYQTVSPETQILIFDDVKRNWDFESKFSLVTEGMTLERKNKDAIKLSVEDSPKLLVSTNYAIKGEGNSHDRRRFELEMAQYYGRNHTPEDDFGKQLFVEWDKDHLNRFYNYMVSCIQKYFNKGLVAQDAKNIKLRKFIAETSMEFHEWISDVNNFPINLRNVKSVYFDRFTTDYKDFNKLSRKRFTIWVQKYASFIGLNYKDGNSNGERWFGIFNESVSESNKSVSEDDKSVLSDYDVPF